MAETELLSYLSVAPNLKVLRRCGTFHLNSNSSQLKRKVHGFYMCLSFTFIMLYVVQQIIYVYQVRADIDKVMDSMFLLLTFVDSIFKQVVFLTRSDEIEQLLEIMKGPYFNQGVEEHRPYLAKTAYQASLLSLVFTNLCIVTTTSLWALLPIISHFKGETVEFSIWLPFDANKGSQFYIAIFYGWFQATKLGYNNTAMDVFIMYMFAQTKTQLSILRNDLETFISKCKAESKATSSGNTNILVRRRLRLIMHHYSEIIRFSDINENIFHVPIFCMFLISGWIICTTAYRTITMSPASGEFLSMILYLICMLSELFLFCFYGNDVAYESDKLMDSAYCSDWVEMPLNQRRDLLIFMERIKYPIIPKAGKIVPLSINTFVQITKASYTFLKLLDTAGISEK